MGAFVADQIIRLIRYVQPDAGDGHSSGPLAPFGDCWIITSAAKLGIGPLAAANRSPIGYHSGEATGTHLLRSFIRDTTSLWLPGFWPIPVAILFTFVPEPTLIIRSNPVLRTICKYAKAMAQPKEAPTLNVLAAKISDLTAKFSTFLKDNEIPEPTFAADSPTSYTGLTAESFMLRQALFDSLMDLIYLTQGPSESIFNYVHTVGSQRTPFAASMNARPLTNAEHA